jgi:Flp pilus assembly CpaF family ATPase
VIQDLDPKLDLANQVEVRRQIEEIFGRVIDEEGLALTRAERVRMLEQITDEIIGLGPMEPLLRDETVTRTTITSCGSSTGSSPRSDAASTSRAQWSTPA